MLTSAEGVLLMNNEDISGIIGKIMQNPVNYANNMICVYQEQLPI